LKNTIFISNGALGKKLCHPKHKKELIGQQQKSKKLEIKIKKFVSHQFYFCPFGKRFDSF